MTTATARHSPAATKTEGVVRTARHLYYFNGQGPWPGVTSITRVLDAPALTNWKLGEVARSATESRPPWVPSSTWACGSSPGVRARYIRRHRGSVGFGRGERI